MKKRLIKKQNKRKINDILKYLKPFHITKKLFGNGYFVFAFQEASVCWFYLKEFPDWKFGLWLNDNKTYSIFGEAISEIDKFKPSYSSLSFENVLDFKNELNVILSGENEDWNEYLKNAEESKKNDSLIYFANKRVRFGVEKNIKELNELYPEDIRLELVDKNTKHFRISPRFEIEMYFNVALSEQKKDYYLDLAFKYLSNNKVVIEDICDFRLDTYIFERKTLYSKPEFEANNKMYGRKNTWTEHLNILKD